MARDLKLQVLLQAVDRVTGPLKQITQGSGRTAQALRASRDQLKELERTQKDMSAFRNLKRQSEANSTALAAEQQRIRKLSQEIAAGTGDTKALTRERAKAIKQAARLKDRYQAEQKQLQQLRSRLAGAAGLTGTMAERQRQLAEQTAAANKRMQQQQERLKKIGALQARMKDTRAAGGNLMQTGGAALQGAAVAGGLLAAGFAATGGSFAAQGEETRQWAERLGVAADELSRLQYVGSQYGVQNDAMIDAIKELSLRTDEFAVTASGPAAEAFERLGLRQQELAALSGDTGELFETVLARLREIDNVAARQRLVDELFGGTGGEQMAEMVSATAEEMGRLYRESDAFGNTMTNEDVKVAQKYTQAWLGAQGALSGLRNTLGRELAPIMTDLFREFTGWIKDNRDGIRSFAQELGSGLRSAVPILLDLGRGATNFFATIARITTFLGQLVGGMDNLAAIAGTLFLGKTLWAAGAFVVTLRKAGSAALALAGGLPAVAAGIKAVGVALMANPIGLIIGGIALAAALIYKNWDAIGPWFASLWEGVKSVFAGAWEGIKALFAWTPLGMVMKNWGPIVEFFSGLGDTIGKVWGWLFGDDEQAGTIQKAGKTAKQAAGAAALGASVAAGPALADVPIDTRPPIAAAAQSAQAAGDSYQFHIYAAPGMDAQAVAHEVERILAQRDRQKAARGRSSLYDRE